jgi:nucleotide-binding universal stress UspA family protein
MGATLHFQASRRDERSMSRHPAVRVAPKMPGSPHSVRGRSRRLLLVIERGGGRGVATIVCGLDDSPGAVEALRVARTLSTNLNLRLVLAHVAAGWNVAAGWTGGADESLSTNQARRGGDLLLERAAREHSLEAERRVEVGEPAEALAQIAAEEAASFIVLGSRRQGRLRPALRSGLAGELAASAPCPVVIVPPPQR